MTVIRLIYTNVSAEQADRAERNWKESCAPLMIQQPGCASEQLLRRTDAPGELISYSEWDSEESIAAYLKSEAHKEIKAHNRNITGAQVSVKHYEVVS